MKIQDQPFCRLPHQGSGGFTLLEMSMVLLIMSLLMGVCIYSFSGLSSEEELRRPAAELQRLAMDAVRRASLQQSAQTIVFEPGGFAMQHRALPSGAQEAGEGQQEWVRRVHLPGAMKLSLKRWGSENFLAAPGQRLVVRPGGLCEPLTARFELGASWLELTLDPLSGDVLEEGMYIHPDS